MAAASLLALGAALWGGVPQRQDMKRALELYEAGLFERAQTLFTEAASLGGGLLAKGYAALCAVRRQEPGAEALARDYMEAAPESKLTAQLRFFMAVNAFDEADYQRVVYEFDRISRKEALPSQLPELTYKDAYSRFALGDMEKARKGFEAIQKLPFSDYTAPAQYSLGYIHYAAKDFAEAFSWYGKAAADQRFKALSGFYMSDCRFQLKDYGYVIEKAPDFEKELPQELHPRLWRMLSEAYLAKGNSAKAKQYYDKVFGAGGAASREDSFYSGSVLYAVGDYKGAIESFERMGPRRDSIGQAADYQLAYSYIQTGDKVSALEAFKEASELPFDPAVRQDAHFNYAKLSFDLNQNPSVFDAYLARYGSEGAGEKIYSYMALSRLYNRDYAGAIEAYSHIDELDSDQKANYMRANYLRASQLISSGAWKDAAPLLKAAAYYSDKRETFSQLSRYWLAESYFRSGDYAAAAEAFTGLYNNSALDGKMEGELLPYNIAYSYFKAGSYPEAVRWFEQYLLEDKPLMGEDAACRRADCDFIAKDYKAAIQGYDKALERFPFKDNLYPLYRKGLAWGLEGKNAEKIKALSAALSARPEAQWYPESVYELGRAYVAEDKAGEAVKCFKLLEASPDKALAAQAMIELGMAYRNLSDYGQSIAYYKKAVELMPGTEYSQDALLGLEAAYQAEGRPDEYLAYSESLGLSSGAGEGEMEALRFEAVRQVFLSGSPSKAAAALEGYFAKYPSGANQAEASCYMAECQQAMGRGEQALDWYARALEASPAPAVERRALKGRAQLAYALEKHALAAEAFGQLLAKASGPEELALARKGLLRSDYALKAYDKAIALAEKVLEAGPDEEASYILAKSRLSAGDRKEAFRLFGQLAAKPSTAYGAEAAYMLIQDTYDRGNFAEVEQLAYKFARKAEGQPYWLAKAYITLGDSFVERGNPDQARATYDSILKGYKASAPGGDEILETAKSRLDKLKTLK